MFSSRGLVTLSVLTAYLKRLETPVNLKDKHMQETLMRDIKNKICDEHMMHLLNKCLFFLILLNVRGNLGISRHW